MSISKKNCPVPFDQQPLNEYFLLKDSKLFAWSIRERRQYFLTTIYLFIALFIICCPIIFWIYPIKHFFIKSIVVNMLVSTVILLLLFIRLYLGWSYIIKRLLSATVFYEESGWYDGQIWIKTAESLMQDRLVGLYEIMPFIKRIQYSIVFLLFFILLNLTFYSLL